MKNLNNGISSILDIQEKIEEHLVSFNSKEEEKNKLISQRQTISLLNNIIFSLPKINSTQDLMVKSEVSEWSIVIKHLILKNLLNLKNQSLLLNPHQSLIQNQLVLKVQLKLQMLHLMHLLLLILKLEQLS